MLQWQRFSVLMLRYIILLTCTLPFIACRLHSGAAGLVHFVAWTLVLCKMEICLQHCSCCMEFWKVWFTIFLTTLPIGSIPPVDTDSFIRALSSVGLQAGAGVIVTVANVKHTGFHKWSWRYHCVAWRKYTKGDIRARTGCQDTVTRQLCIPTHHHI